MVGMNGKLYASLITGTNIENPGAEPGEVLEAISRREDRGVVIVFDEIEKAARECKEACGILRILPLIGGIRILFEIYLLLLMSVFL